MTAPADLSTLRCALCLYCGPDEDGVTRFAVHASGIDGMSTGAICHRCWQLAAANPGGWKRLAADEVVCKREMLTEAAKYMESAADYIPGDFPARTAVTNRAQELRAKAGEGCGSGSANATSGDR